MPSLESEKKSASLLVYLKKYWVLIAFVVFCSLAVNILGLVIPKIVSPAIDKFLRGNFDQSETVTKFGFVIGLIFIFTVLQQIFGNYTSEKIAADLRQQVANRISEQSFTYINSITTSRILTNLTSDVDAVKNFISQGIVVVFSSIILLIGSAVMLFSINWQLAIPVILVIPALLIIFMIIFSRINKYFTKAQEIVDRLNRVINESIVSASLIRVLNSHKYEEQKFEEVNTDSKNIGLAIVAGFASLIPFINLAANFAMLVVIWWGGNKVIDGTMSFGDLTAFFTYIGTFIMPIILLGFLGNVVVRAFASYNRIAEVLHADVEGWGSTAGIKDVSDKTIRFKGELSMCDINLTLDNRSILQDICFDVKPGTRTAIIGPTAAGKSQIFYLIAGLIKPDSGELRIDGKELHEYNPKTFYQNVGLVFQDSIIFNTTIRENIAFGDSISEDAMKKAIETAELDDFIKTLPQGLDTIISERGTSLSGGQKQRLTLARALALDPKILLLDDFTARVDINTEKRIFANLEKNYPDLTLLVISQKIASVQEFEQIVLIMEGELLAKGKHDDLLKNSFEYQQIWESQKSTE